MRNPPQGAPIGDVVKAHQVKAKLRGAILHKVASGEYTFVDVLHLAMGGDAAATSITVRQIFDFSPQFSKELQVRVRKRFAAIYKRPVPMQASVGWLIHQEAGGARLVALCEALRSVTGRVTLNSSERRTGVGPLTRVESPWPRFPFGGTPPEHTRALSDRARTTGGATA